MVFQRFDFLRSTASAPLMSRNHGKRTAVLAVAHATRSSIALFVRNRLDCAPVLPRNLTQPRNDCSRFSDGSVLTTNKEALGDLRR